MAQQSEMESLLRPQTTFLSLPREIRDEIYDFALLASSSIVVCSSRWVDPIAWKHADCYAVHRGPDLYTLDQGNTSDDHVNDIDEDTKGPDEYACDRVVNTRATKLSIQGLALNLLRCKNTTVAREAAMTFYTKNTFSFLGDHNWDPIIFWLESIGARNRSYLTRLDVRARQPRHAWQRSDGTRIKIPTLHDEVYPRSPHLYLSPESTKEGEVENINPAIEKMFALLGIRDSKSTLKLHLLLDKFVLPGVKPVDYDRSADEHFFSMDLPNLVEKFRLDYTMKDESCSPVEVLWMGKTVRHSFNDNRSLMQKHGWEIVKTEDEDPPELTWCGTVIPPIFRIRFTLRKREQPAKLVAEDPSPYSNHLGFDDN